MARKWIVYQVLYFPYLQNTQSLIPPPDYHAQTASKHYTLLPGAGLRGVRPHYACKVLRQIQSVMVEIQSVMEQIQYVIVEI